MVKFPMCVVVYLTDYCNLKCRHCFLTQTNNLNKNMLDTNKLKELLKLFKDNNVFMIAYSGGDAMLHKDLFEILNYTSDLGMLPLLGISGPNVSLTYAKKIYDSGVRCVQIGLNGSDEKTNSYYRGKGNFSKALKSFHNLKDNNVNVNLAFCLDKHNLFDLENMLNLANSIDAYKIKIEFWCCVNNSNNSNELTEAEKDKVRKTCDEYMLNLNKKDWIQYPKSSSHLTKIHTNALIIMSNGDIKRSEMGEVLGNIYKDSILNILEVKKNE